MLTDIKARAAKPAEKVYRLYDGGGMYLEVPPSGNKRWRLKYRFNGKEKRLSLGVYPNVGLKEAREKRDELRRLIAEGIDPAAQRCPQKVAPTADSFEMVAREWMDLRSPAWAPRHLSTTCQRLEAYIFPHIGPLPIDQIGPLDVLNALRIVEKRGAVEAARKTLSICSQVFRYAVASARIQSDPCRDLRGALKTRQPDHYAAIVDPKDVGALMRAIDGYSGAMVVRCALRFLALTFVRPGELRAAEWNEFDMERRIWTIPAHKMKKRREHIVPLSTQALAVLRDVRATAPRLNSPVVFQSVRLRSDRGLSENTLLVALRSLGYGQGTMTAHGFRAMASSLLNGLGYNPDVIERQLAHIEGNKIRAAYHRTEYLEERTAMMQAYADYLDSLRDSMPPR